MKHPVRDRILIMLYALVTLCVAAGVLALAFGQIPYEPIEQLFFRAFGVITAKKQVVLTAAAVVLALLALLLISAILPARKQRSSSFAIQRNENGMVRISLKALDALVQRCLGQHAELKVVSSSLYSDEESVRVDVHISLQADISMPLAISSLQKQIKKYLEACSGVAVQEVRVFVDGTLPTNADTVNSPFAIPASMLGFQDALPGGMTEAYEVSTASSEVIDAVAAAPDYEAAYEAEAPAYEEPAVVEQTPAAQADDAAPQEAGEEQGEQA